MRLLKNEARRLRRKYLKKVRRRGYSYRAYDQWLDREYAKTALPLVPAMVVLYGDGQSTLADVLFWLGAGLSVLWFGFVSWAWMSVAARLADKQYMLVTRKHLSKEYRR